MFNLIDTRDNRTIAKNISGNKDRMEVLTRKRIAVRDWAAFQLRRAG